MMDVHHIPIDRVTIGERLRAVDADYVSLIASSMGDIGQMTPIEVRAISPAHWELVSGAHRIAAAKLLRWTDIHASVLDVGVLDAELRQIDENLVRRELSPYDRATFLARRQDVYLALHPDATQGKVGMKARWHTTDKLSVVSCATDVAGKLGVSPRDIRRSIARFTQIAPDVREKIVGTWVADNGAALDALARAEPSDQRRAIVVMLRPEDPVRSVKAALLLVNGAADAPVDVDAEQLAKLLRAWKDAGKQAKALFFTHLKDQGFVEPNAKFSVGREFA